MVGERLARILGRASLSQGVRPVSPEDRRLSGLDLAVLWGDLAIGLLVLVTGALLVPALGLPKALLAVLVGSTVGCLPLALVGSAGAREGIPSMVLFRPILGARGSYVPSILNLAQLLGWTAVEFWAMGRIANAVSVELFGFDSYAFWLAIVAIVCTGLAIGGPVLVVRKWLERFGLWVLSAAGLFITYKLVTAGSFQDALRAPGAGGFPSFWAAVDLVIVMPISWLPLVADYNRFAKRDARVFAGTYCGYFLGNAWFYALGALLVLSAGATADVEAIGTAIISVAGGVLVLMVLLAGETDEAFANIYSGAVSVQNVAPRIPQLSLILGVSAAGFLLALFLTMDLFESFLYLIGSVFVPLFGVFAASYFVLGRRDFSERDLFEPGGRAWYRSGVNWAAFVPWTAGFLVYHWNAPLAPDAWMRGVETLIHNWLGLPFPLFGGAIGASAPGFVVAFLLALLVLAPRRHVREGAPSSEGQRTGPPTRS
ncbi:MAG: cytosine permease [Actinomycetota bacterium]